AVRCVSGLLSVIVGPFGEVSPCYQVPTSLNVRDMSLEEIVLSEQFDDSRRRVAACEAACWDVGPAEPSICFHLPYLLAHPLKIWRQARLNT
ncbi:hypothetical protein LCGC14_2411200, partial [marine sediment metagenome]